MAQSLHRIDIRLRLGLLQDPAAIDRQIAREAAEAELRRKAREAPTVPTKEQADADAKLSKEERQKIEDKLKAEEKERAKRRKIRPLSEAKAIDSGANFISEAFLFLVAAGLIGFETLRNRNKEAGRREDVKERLENLEGRLEEIEGQRNVEREWRIRLQERESLMRQELKRSGVVWSERPAAEKATHKVDMAGRRAQTYVEATADRQMGGQTDNYIKASDATSAGCANMKGTGRQTTLIGSVTSGPKAPGNQDRSKD